MTPEQEARLPVFARRAIAELRYDLTRARAAAEEARLATDPDGSLVLIERNNYPNPDAGIGLGHSVVSFRLGLGCDWSEVFEVRPVGRPDGRGIEVSYRGGPLCVIPSSSNVVKIRPTEW